MKLSPTPNSLSDRQPLWHTLSATETLNQLDSNVERGLADGEVQRRLQHYGANEIESATGRSSWQILLDQFTDIMLLMLIAVAIVSGILDLIHLKQSGAVAGEIPFKDTLAIMIIVTLNGILGYLQESRAEKALAALKNMTSPVVQVLRNGQKIELPAPKLVPGDIIFLAAGDRLCADGQIIEASSFQVQVTQFFDHYAIPAPQAKSYF